MPNRELLNLEYGSHLVHEINHSSSTIYNLSNIVYITQMETSSDRFLNLGMC